MQHKNAEQFTCVSDMELKAVQSNTGEAWDICDEY